MVCHAKGKKLMAFKNLTPYAFFKYNDRLFQKIARHVAVCTDKHGMAIEVGFSEDAIITPLVVRIQIVSP